MSRRPGKALAATLSSVPGGAHRGKACEVQNAPGSNARARRPKRRSKKGTGIASDPLRVFVSRWTRHLIGEHHLELFHDLLFRMRLGDGQFLNQQAACRVEHLALAEGQFLVALEYQQVAQDL